MNRENVLKVADAIERHAFETLGFNMGSFLATGVNPKNDLSGHACGTIACIGGWAVVVRHGSVEAAELIQYSMQDDATEFLGLDGKTAHTLFFPVDEDWDARPAQAVAVLRHLAETGEVDWSVAPKVSA